MTAQIVIINQSGIAIASDSLTSSMGGHGDMIRKATPGAHKIYSLPSQHDIVVLHSGAVYLGNIQYQLLINEWARSLRDKGPYERLEQYVESFDNFVSQWRVLELNEASQIARAIRTELHEAWSSTKRGRPDLIDAELSKEKDESVFKKFDSESEDVIIEMLNHTAEHFLKLEPFADLSLDKAIKTIKTSEFNSVESFKFFFDQEEISEKLQSEVVKFCAERLRRYEAGSTSLNFVGFGSSEPIGGVIEVSVESFHSNKLRFHMEQRRPSLDKHEDLIYPIAQTSATDQFMYGYDLKFSRKMNKLAEDTLADLIDSEGPLYTEFFEKFREGLSKIRNDNKSEVYDTLSILGIQALEKMAHFLIQSQSFQAAAVDEQTSVGGLIETVVITRERGVEWSNKQNGQSSHVFA